MLDILSIREALQNVNLEILDIFGMRLDVLQDLIDLNLGFSALVKLLPEGLDLRLLANLWLHLHLLAQQLNELLLSVRVILLVSILLQSLHIIELSIVEVFDDGSSEVVRVSRVRTHMPRNVRNQLLEVHISHGQVL